MQMRGESGVSQAPLEGAWPGLVLRALLGGRCGRWPVLLELPRSAEVRRCGLVARGSHGTRSRLSWFQGDARGVVHWLRPLGTVLEWQVRSAA